MESSEASSARPGPSSSLRRSLSCSSSSSAAAAASSSVAAELKEERRKKEFQKVLQQCLRALEMLGEEDDPSSDSPAEDSSAMAEEEMEETGNSTNRPSTDTGYETDEVGVVRLNIGTRCSKEISLL